MLYAFLFIGFLSLYVVCLFLLSWASMPPLSCRISPMTKIEAHRTANTVIGNSDANIGKAGEQSSLKSWRIWQQRLARRLANEGEGRARTGCLAVARCEATALSVSI